MPAPHDPSRPPSEASGAAQATERVRGQLAEIVRLVTALPPHEVRLERRWVDDLRVDSLAMVEILEGAAVHFGVRLEDEAAKQLVHVGDLVDYLLSRGA